MAAITVFDGKNIVEIEVDEQFASVYKEIEHKEHLVNRKETRRHISLDLLADKGKIFEDKTVNIEEDCIKQIDNETLHKAIRRLTFTQQDLLRKIYFEEQSITSVAKDYGVDKTSIRDRLKTIYKKLKKFM